MKEKGKILALGAESFGRFCVWDSGKMHVSGGFGSLFDENNFTNFTKAVSALDKRNFSKIIVDLHPSYSQSCFGIELSKKRHLPLVGIQHHIAHIHSAACEYDLKDFTGIALDGTGYGFDGTIWGGEVFCVKSGRAKRIGSLEQFALIGGDAAIREPVRVLVAILDKFLNKKEIFKIAKPFYDANQFELIFNQFKTGFNCCPASSAGRVMDAAACLLFGENGQKAAFLLSKESRRAYSGPKPILVADKDKLLRLQLVPLFKYLLANLKKDKSRLAGAVQRYIAEGMFEIASKPGLPIVAAGGAVQAEVIKSIFEKNGVLLPKKNPLGDGGLAFGQVYAYLNLNKSAG